SAPARRASLRARASRRAASSRSRSTWGRSARIHAPAGRLGLAGACSPYDACVRAVVLDANGQPELAELAEPSGAGVLVEVTGCGLCGSDVEKLGHAPNGAVLGHEVDGMLEDGTRVTVLHRVPCGECERCRAGHESTCDAFAQSRISPGGFA